jgi:hypothetical protein
MFMININLFSTGVSVEQLPSLKEWLNSQREWLYVRSPLLIDT